MTSSTHLRPDLTDKVVVVTGSSRGIGKAIAIACAQRGAAVVLNEETRSASPLRKRPSKNTRRACTWFAATSAIPKKAGV